MRCKSCDNIIPDKHLKIDDELCQPCLRLVSESLRELELHELKEANKNG